jgi:hypothetical protein
MRSIADIVVREIATDSDDQTERLVRDYEAATAIEQKAIDNAFISLCGWSLKTLITRAKGGRA